MTKIIKSKSKRKPTVEEIAHDPSLRWHPTYLRYEQLWSERHGMMVRFLECSGEDEAVVATHAAITPLPGTVKLLELRRFIS